MSDCLVLTTVPGTRKSYTFQTYLDDGRTKGFYNATDVLTASYRRYGMSTDLFVPAVGWQTKDMAGNTQTGYDQGMVVVTRTSAQADLLVPSVAYTILVWRALVSDPSDKELIVRVKLLVERLVLFG